MNNMNPTKTSKTTGRPRVLRDDTQFMFHMWHPPCYSYYKPDDRSWL